jgi:hypothetical protein
LWGCVQNVFFYIILKKYLYFLWCASLIDPSSQKKHSHYGHFQTRKQGNLSIWSCYIGTSLKFKILHYAFYWSEYTSFVFEYTLTQWVLASIVDGYCVGLAYRGKDIVFRFIIEYSSLMDFGPYGIGLFWYEDFWKMTFWLVLKLEISL